MSDPSVAAWMRAGTALFAGQVSELDEQGVRAPSRLDGWTRAHVVAHVARNAEALARLATWARTGVETPMYSGPGQRNADIEASAPQGPDRLRADLRAANTVLDDALSALSPEQWNNEVRTAQGGSIPATRIPWMRVREVWLHTVDLGTGLDLSAAPGDLIDAMLDDVTSAFAARDGVPAVTLTPDDRAASWTIHGGGETVTGTAADLLGWLTGRPGTVHSPGGVPDLPPWL